MIFGNKRKSFAVLMDGNSRSRSFIELIKSVPSLKERFNLTTITDGDWVIFGTSKDYDYEIITNETIVMQRKINRLYSLLSDTEEVLDNLREYVKKNKKRQTRTVSVSYSEPIGLITFETERPVVKKTTYISAEPVTVHDTFVKVGYDYFVIKVDPYTEEEYVKIDGKVYLVKRGRNGEGYLA